MKNKIRTIVIDELTSFWPFSALRFYSVDGSTLTAILRTVLTYFIILYQTLTCPAPITSSTQEMSNSTYV